MLLTAHTEITLHASFITIMSTLVDLSSNSAKDGKHRYQTLYICQTPIQSVAYCSCKQSTAPQWIKSIAKEEAKLCYVCRLYPY